MSCFESFATDVLGFTLNAGAPAGVGKAGHAGHPSICAWRLTTSMTWGAPTTWCRRAVYQRTKPQSHMFEPTNSVRYRR